MRLRHLIYRDTEKPGGQRSLRGERRRSYGQSLVEFVLIAPVFVMMVMGVVDLGRVFYTYEALANAAREGARYCALHGHDTFATGDISAGTIARVQGELDGTVSNPTVSGSPGTKVCDTSNINSGTSFSVTASTTFTPISPVIAALLPNHTSLTITSSVTMLMQ